ncbi:hypothetical protein KC343_g13403 [Hortaea werneckii]|uniref:Uncharacterized protein n=1 Tax=Hortaea werneckii TaxID=91943 RepID=A0A3M7EZL4_HORWE|nr:hypothetical protein KC338_g7218 [Hortaea werneckii]KAI6865830.1 hypothetical protein KC323_g4204 [Hortaea werneckii]KAI7140856.1 hypothetical protein KC352_g29507 [Hortaea werneckii]KAI7353833.1 hypothetical protein KC320_g3765 [Hortaea werneckii]KAI7544379.1 hypothetical protein KC317_g16029 [Hortaea werneckii]
MEEDYDYDDDQFLEYDGDWIFVEDEYGLADELAESQVPEPGYSGTNAEIALESFDYDIYNYWDDVDYLADDAYWDYEGKVSPGEDSQSTGQKRKRATPARGSAASKRRKVSGKDVAEGAVPGRGQMDNVMFVSREEQVRLALQRGPVLKRSKPVAFLGDWRKRYANVDGEVLVGQMPADMEKAAQAGDATRGQSPDQEIASAAVPGSQEDEEGWEDEEEENASTAGDAVEGFPSLDPDMLKQILRQRMGDAGLDGIDEGAFMDTISKMLAGGSDEDDVAGDLANNLLGQATEGGGNSAFSDWLSGQGVSLDAAEEDETSSNAEASISHGDGQSSIPGSATASQTSPLDSAIALESSQASRDAVTPTNSRAKDAQSSKGTVGGRKKRPAKQVAFDDSSVGEPKINIESTEEKWRDDGKEAPKSEAPTPARSTRSKAVSSPAPSKKSTRSNEKANPGQQLQHELQDDARDSAANDPAPTTSTEKGRKRKAADDDELSQNNNKGNRKAKEPATRRTRSARAKNGGK